MSKNNKLSYKEAHRILDYNPDTGILRWKKDHNNQIKAGDIAGSFNASGYKQVNIKGSVYYVHRIIWLMHYGYFPEHNIDHIDKIKHHNWISNLREVTQQCNMRNCGNPKNNTSGVKGVHWNKKRKQWQVTIMIKYKTKHLGWFKDFSEAVCRRLITEQCLNWEGCDSNSPAYQYVQKNIRRYK